MQDYEKLGAFYLGRGYDLEQSKATEELLLYDARDLTTHAVCVGMTGSGKTGLCIALLEEAAIDGIPALVIDPKGDIGNLLLTFPDLRPSDFRPWIDETDAARQGTTPDELAARTADLWRQGLAASGQPPERIARLRAAAEVAIYTPGSGAGIQLALLKSLAPPSEETRADGESYRERIAAVVSSLLGLLGIQADPIRSREHILLSRIVDNAWTAGRSIEIGDLVGAVQDPPFDRVGVLPLEQFYPAKERSELTLALNHLLASPGFEAWLEGEALDIGKLLWTSEGKPRVAILSIAHLNEAQRMFFVTLVLSELLSWMRAQSGTTSLRALFYMDEIFGYFPPAANPPSKTPLLTLLKQARAFGLGCVLATQNPVDLDYKGLSNCGTWFLGRLQTERDKLRVLEGLEGAAASSGTRFDRARMEQILAGLGKRVFLMQNVHEDAPILFQTRWTMSFLRGPLQRPQIQTLMAAKRGAIKSTSSAPSAGASPKGRAAAAEAAGRPVLPPEIPQRFLPAAVGQSTYRPGLFGSARLHFVDSKLGIDLWESVCLLAPLGGAAPWDDGEAYDDDLTRLAADPAPGMAFEPLPAEAAQTKTYNSWKKSLAEMLYRTAERKVLRCDAFKLTAKAVESRSEFLARVRLAAREARDAEVEKLKKLYAPKLAALQERVRRAEARVEKEHAQYSQQKLSTALSFGAGLLGALFGRKVASAANVGRAATTVRGMGRAMQEKADVDQAAESLDVMKQKLDDLEAEFQAAAAQIEAAPEPETLVTEVAAKPRKSDTVVEQVMLAWIPG